MSYITRILLLLALILVSYPGLSKNDSNSLLGNQDTSDASLDTLPDDITYAFAKTLEPDTWAQFITYMMDPRGVDPMDRCVLCHSDETIDRYNAEIGPMIRKGWETYKIMPNPHEILGPMLDPMLGMVDHTMDVMNPMMTPFMSAMKPMLRPMLPIMKPMFGFINPMMGNINPFTSSMFSSVQPYAQMISPMMPRPFLPSSNFTPVPSNYIYGMPTPEEYRRLYDHLNKSVLSNDTRPDKRIRNDIVDEITDSHAFNNNQIRIDVDDGVVELEGVVDNVYEKNLLKKKVDEAVGVEKLENNISVK